jgi:hypothetical protein
LAHVAHPVGIIAVCLDHPTHLKTIGHIFFNEKADFYEIVDDLPKFGESSYGEMPGDHR